MARLPRDVSGARLIALLEALGYRVVRRKGSHVRLERPGPDAHAITVPDHAALRIGTLAAILQEVGAATQNPRDALIEMLER
jgi:predicted RNA binding protein YcfA (HicA-like mRNA interferase family)